MGDPKRFRKRYKTPTHPWITTRIEEEKKLLKEYGLSRKKEIWKMDSKLKNFFDQAKQIVSMEKEKAEEKKRNLIQKLQRLGFLSKNSEFDDILGLTIKDIMERRLQTIVFKKGLARTMKQARQFITHRHILVGDRVITMPSYIVPVDVENNISFIQLSSLSNPEHPERKKEIEKQKKEELIVKEEKGKKKKPKRKLTLKNVKSRKKKEPKKSKEDKKQNKKQKDKNEK